MEQTVRTIMPDAIALAQEYIGEALGNLAIQIMAWFIKLTPDL